MGGGEAASDFNHPEWSGFTVDETTSHWITNPLGAAQNGSPEVAVTTAISKQARDLN